MPYIKPEAVLEAKKMDLLTYLQNYEPNELVKISNNNYTTKTHDSLKISNGKWMWWSRGFGGYSALDYLVKVKGYSFFEAVETLVGKGAVKPSSVISKPKQKQDKVLLLPKKCADNKAITKYLIGRGIDKNIIEYCITNALIFESMPYHNIVFVGYDNEQVARFASYRAINKDEFMGDCSGSDKRFSFRIINDRSDDVHLFECAIDLLSYATLVKMKGLDFRKETLISLAGVYMPKQKIEESVVPSALKNHLETHKTINRIYIHFDNDIAGKSATKALQILLKDKYEVVDSPPPFGKDFNDFLCCIKSQEGGDGYRGEIHRKFRKE